MNPDDQSAPPVTPDSSVSEEEIAREAVAEWYGIRIDTVQFKLERPIEYPGVKELYGHILAAIRKAKAVQETQGRWATKGDSAFVELVDEKGETLATYYGNNGLITATRIRDAHNASEEKP